MVIYLVVVLLSSFVGDSIILIATVKHGTIKLNKFIVAVMQNSAICDLLRSVGFVLPSMISLIADEWILGDIMAWINSFLNEITFIGGNYFIAVKPQVNF